MSNFKKNHEIRRNYRGKRFTGREQKGGQGLVNTVIPDSTLNQSSQPSSFSGFSNAAKNFAKQAALVAAQEAQKIALATAMAGTEEAGRVANENLQNISQGKSTGNLQDILKAGAQRVALQATNTATQQAQAAALQGVQNANNLATKSLGISPNSTFPSNQMFPIKGAPVTYSPQPFQLQQQQQQQQQQQPQQQLPMLQLPMKQIKPVAQMSASERKTAILNQLSRCLPQIQTMDEFSEFLVQCLSQAAGELYVPSQADISDLSAALKTMRDRGVDFSDPEIVKILLYGTRTTKMEQLLDLVPGYDDIIHALDKITSGPKISTPDLETLETATAQEMQTAIPEAVQAAEEDQSGGYYYAYQYGGCDSDYSEMDEYHSGDYSDDLSEDE